MPTAVRSHAKINLGLYIGAPRPDGFHGLATVYQTLELYDVVTVTARPAPTTAIIGSPRTTAAFPPTAATLRGRWSSWR
jgi:4-diphosphocytidyl-2C-methyl-D-erythritol kinase